MKVIIGIQHVARELALDIDMTHEEFTQAVCTAVSTAECLQLTDTQGQHYVIPGRAIAFTQVVTEAPRRVGFTS